jgi:hypothetical protein
MQLAALPWENVVFIIIFLIVGLFQWIAQEAAKRKKGQRPSDATKPSRPTPVAREETDTERIRRFLEALGQPPDAKPPSPAQTRPAAPRPATPRTITPRQRPLAAPFPPLTTVPPDLPSPAPEPPPVPQMQPAPVVAIPPPSAPTAPPAPPALPIAGQEIARTTAAVVAFPEAQTLAAIPEVFALLKSASGLREAIVLREIFGPPRSLQPFDLI